MMDLQQSMMQIYRSFKSFENTNSNDDNKQDEAKVADGDWKKIGNQHFVFKKYKAAVRAYTKGIERNGISIDLLANRAAAYLALTRYKLALDDVENVLAIDKKHLKCIYRKVKALFGMKRYDDAMAFIKTITLESLPPKDHEIITDLIAKGETYIAQSKNGDYPWYELYTSTSIYHDMADFTGSVIVNDCSTKGRGLFATKSIKMGELILASKAFAYLQDHVQLPKKNPNSISSQWTQTDLLLAQINLQLTHKMLQILDENPYKCQELYSLYAGPKWSPLAFNDRATTKDLNIEVERVESISLYNRISNYDDSDGDGSVKRNSGIWIFPSFLNHDCIDANSSWQNFGDFLFVRAHRNIAEGEEIVITYRVPNGIIAQEQLDNYDFTCTCRLCERDRLDIKSIQTMRGKLFAQLQSILGKFKNPNEPRMGNEVTKKVLQILKLFKQTRPDSPDLNLCLSNELLVFGILRLEIFEFAEAAKIFEDLYITIRMVPGFFITLVDVCIHAVVAYTTAGNIPKANHWIKITKETTRLVYGTEQILQNKYPTYVDIIREKGLDL